VQEVNVRAEALVELGFFAATGLGGARLAWALGEVPPPPPPFLPASSAAQLYVSCILGPPCR
jgi:hypothetical protein